MLDNPIHLFPSDPRVENSLKTAFGLFPPTLQYFAHNGCVYVLPGPEALALDATNLQIRDNAGRFRQTYVIVLNRAPVHYRYSICQDTLKELTSGVVSAFLHNRGLTDTETVDTCRNLWANAIASTIPEGKPLTAGPFDDEIPF